jgi:multidrug efflux pump
MTVCPAGKIYQSCTDAFSPNFNDHTCGTGWCNSIDVASGSGAELRQPLGIVMVGGLILSQVLTLFTTPVVYLFFDRLQYSLQHTNSVYL